MENRKIWYASKTVWVNALTLIGSVVMLLSPQISVETWATITGLALPVINLILRKITNEEIIWSK